MGSVTHCESLKADGSRSQRTSCKAFFLCSAGFVDQFLVPCTLNSLLYGDELFLVSITAALFIGHGL
jgi:hypothetical protein